VLETVYTHFEPSVIHICWKIDKRGGERNIFSENLFELFSALFILPLCCQNHQVS
jgi:hypothetical protein